MKSYIKNYISGVIWITGVSGSGKSTLANMLKNKFIKKGVYPVCFDGDQIRDLLKLNKKSNELIYDIKARKKLGLIYAKLANKVYEDNQLVIVSTISLYKEIEDWNIKNNKNFYQIFISTDLKNLLERDPKKIYKSYNEGKIKNIVGIDIEFDYPKYINYILFNNNSKKDLRLQTEIIINEIIHKFESK